MYRFIRKATVRNAASMPTACRLASEICAHVNLKHGIGMHFGVQVYSAPRIHWHVDVDNLERMHALNMQLADDSVYLALLAQCQDVLVDGSLQDTLVLILG